MLGVDVLYDTIFQGSNPDFDSLQPNVDPSYYRMVRHIKPQSDMFSPRSFAFCSTSTLPQFLRVPCPPSKNSSRLDTMCASSSDPSLHDHIPSDPLAISTSVKVGLGHHILPESQIYLGANLQYYFIALTTLLFYDYFLTLPDEVRPYTIRSKIPPPSDLIQVRYAWKGRKSWGASSGLRGFNSSY